MANTLRQTLLARKYLRFPPFGRKIGKFEQAAEGLYLLDRRERKGSCAYIREM